MKITFVCPPLNMSGGIRVVAIYADYLHRAGHDVMVVSPAATAQGRWPRLLRRIGGPALPAGVQLTSHFDGLPVPRHRLRHAGPVRDSDVPDADVVVATWWETAEWVARLSARKGRRIYFVQHHELFDGMPIDRVEATYRLPMRKIVIARWLANVMAERYGDTRTTLVPNAYDPARFFAEPRGRQPRPTIGTLFHETRFKAFDITLQVVAEVRRRLGDVHVIAFGDTPPNRFRGQVDDIEIHVNPPQQDIRRLYASCDVWLSCSRTEGFNLTAMEAMACRTPVVSTRTGWPEEAVRDGFNGALADVDDVQGLADGVEAVLRASDSQWRELSDNAAATVAGSSWENSARMFEQALVEAAAS